MGSPPGPASPALLPLGRHGAAAEVVQNVLQIPVTGRGRRRSDRSHAGHRHRSPGTNTDHNRNTKCDGGLRSVVGVSSRCMSGKSKKKKKW